MLMRDDWHPDGVQATMEHINGEVMTLVQIETAREPEAVDGIAAIDGIDVLALLERGFRLLAYSIDIWLYEEAVRAGIAGLRD
jgi:hypothetical protein